MALIIRSVETCALGPPHPLAGPASSSCWAHLSSCWACLVLLMGPPCPLAGLASSSCWAHLVLLLGPCWACLILLLGPCWACLVLLLGLPCPLAGPASSSCWARLVLLLGPPRPLAGPLLGLPRPLAGPTSSSFPQRPCRSRSFSLSCLQWAPMCRIWGRAYTLFPGWCKQIKMML